MSEFAGFSPELFKFLRQLEKNNNRDWFQENKQRYEEYFMGDSLKFIEAIQKPLEKISPHFTAIPKRSGGSLMRIYRDVRFSKNKSPYKTNIGIHFRHEVGKDVHAPGFYFHISQSDIFVGGGVWKPDNSALTMIREGIDDQQTRWKRIRNAKKLKSEFEMRGDSLKRPPRGFDLEHPLIDDLKRKDHLYVGEIPKEELLKPTIVKTIAAKFKTMKPFVAFLCESMRLPA